WRPRAPARCARSRSPRDRRCRRETPSRSSTDAHREGDAMSIALIREHYDYHRWANRRLFDVASGLGDGVTRDMGPQWSFPTLKGMFAHIYGADNIWLTRWKGSSPNRLWGDADFTSMAELRAKWDALEAEQRAFVAGLADADLTRPVPYRNTEGKAFEVSLGA